MMETTEQDQENYCFHCGRCGSLFLDSLDYAEQRVCPVCGMHPTPGHADVSELAPPIVRAVEPLEPATLTRAQLVRARHVGGRRHVLLKVVVVWMLLLVGIFLLARWIVEDDPAAEELVGPVAGEPAEVAADPDREEWLKLVIEDCTSTLGKFLSTEVIAERYPLVISTERVQERMDEFYRQNPIMTIAPADLVLKASTVVDLPEGKCVLIQWETVQGHQLDSAFRLEGVSWKLDWDHFVRYSDMDWALFTAGSGPDEAEFRLLARERFEVAGVEPGTYGMVLYAPKLNRIADAGFKAQMLPMSPDGRDAKLLMAAFKQMRDNRPIFGAEFRDINPQDMIRVRVRVKRHQSPGRYNFEITKVVACHWYGSSAWGVTLEELEALDAGEHDNADVVSPRLVPDR